MMDMSTIVTLDGHKLIYTTASHPDGPLLLMIHGWCSHRGVWRQALEAFKDSHYCVAVDLLGFGHSDKPEDADYSIKAQGQRILQLADALGFDKFSLIGHSMGGQIVLCIASMLAPERVKKLVSVAGVVTDRLMPRVERVTYWQVAMGAVFPWLYALARWLSRYRWYAYFHFRPWFYKMGAVPFNDWEIDRRMALQPGVHISTYKAGQAIHGLNLTAHLPKVTATTLTIFGQQDGTVPISDGYLVEQHVPDSRLVLIDQCGHFPMYEQTEQYLDTLRVFLLD
jgi:pimeloyl-ACP methyl ester carboxylesterase